MSIKYKSNDQVEKLGPTPWHGLDPVLIAWELAHGHDARLSCNVEDGCYVALEELLTECNNWRGRYEELKRIARAFIEELDSPDWLPDEYFFSIEQNEKYVALVKEVIN